MMTDFMKIDPGSCDRLHEESFLTPPVDACVFLSLVLFMAHRRTAVIEVIRTIFS